MLYIKSYQYDKCKKSKFYSRKYTKQQICDIYDKQKNRCQFIIMKYYVYYKEIILQKSCIKYKKMLFKYISKCKFYFILF